jgi:hypothetical protein
MRNIYNILEYKSQIKEIEKILQEAGGQVWEKYFLEKPLGDIYKDLTPNQIQRLENIIKTIPTPELQYIQREANMYGTILGVSAGAGVAIKSALILSALLAKIKLRRKK